MIKNIYQNSEIMAIIIYSNHEEEGIKFLTPNNFSQQLGYMKRPKGYIINPHVHIPFSREVFYTKEVLFIKKGKMRIDFYDNDQNYIESKILSQGDVILLAFGGHGIEILEETEIIEVKQGPYAGELDKNHFKPVEKSQVTFRE